MPPCTATGALITLLLGASSWHFAVASATPPHSTHPFYLSPSHPRNLSLHLQCQHYFPSSHSCRKSTYHHFRLLPFVIGAWRWDNYWLAQAVTSPDIVVVDATPAAQAYHQGTTDVEHTGNANHLARVGAEYNDRMVVHAMGLSYLLGTYVAPPSLHHKRIHTHTATLIIHQYRPPSLPAFSCSPTQVPHSRTLTHVH